MENESAPVPTSAQALSAARAADAVMDADDQWGVDFALIDTLNLGCGYQIRIERRGHTVYFSSKHPVDGRDLDYRGCVEVAAMYGPKRKADRVAAAAPDLLKACRAWSEAYGIDDLPPSLQRVLIFTRDVIAKAGG